MKHFCVSSLPTSPFIRMITTRYCGCHPEAIEVLTRVAAELKPLPRTLEDFDPGLHKVVCYA